MRDNPRRWLVGIAGVVLFLAAVRALGTAVESMEPAMERLLPRLLAGPASALGMGWAATYVLFNGSVVAAVAVVLASGGLVSAGETFLIISGSRLGAASFVILVGLVDYVQSSRRQTIREALGLGLLTFLVTHTVYLPATGLGLLGTAELGARLGRTLGSLDVPFASFEFVQPAVGQLVRIGGALPVFLLALALLVVAIRLADRTVRSMDQKRLRERYLSRLDRPWISFGLGLLLAVFTASIAFSVGIAVPFYNRGHLPLGRILPYLLGASLGTLADTLVVGLVLESPVGTATVLALTFSAAVVVALVAVFYGRYVALVDKLMEVVTASRRAFLLFGLSLILAPLLLSLVPLLR